MVSDVLAAIAILLALIGLFASYDNLLRKIIYHFFDLEDHIDIEVQTVTRTYIEQGRSANLNSLNYLFARDRYEIPEGAVDDTPDEEIQVTIRLRNSSPNGRIRCVLRVVTEPIVLIPFQYPEVGFQSMDLPYGREFDFNQISIRAGHSGTPWPAFTVPLFPGATIDNVPFKFEFQFMLDASQFTVPIIDKKLPHSVGEINYVMERDFTMIGPDNPSYTTELSQHSLSN